MILKCYCCCLLFLENKKIVVLLRVSRFAPLEREAESQIPKGFIDEKELEIYIRNCKSFYLREEMIRFPPLQPQKSPNLVGKSFLETNLYFRK